MSIRQALLLVLKDDEQVCNCGRGVAKLGPAWQVDERGVTPTQTWQCLHGCGPAQMRAADRIAEALLEKVK